MNEELYPYKDLLNRIYQNIESKRDVLVKQPIIFCISSKRTGWVNFKECCNNINRDFVHLKLFVENELSCQCNFNGNGILIIKGIFSQKNIDIIFRKYINQYVQCTTCKSIETNIKKDKKTRICFIKCFLCESARSINYYKYVV